MTVIAWDGKTLAADKQRSFSGTTGRTTKLFRIASGEVLAIAGNEAMGRLLVDWYVNGANPTEWPEAQKTEDWARLVVASKSGLKYFEKFPVAIELQEPFYAFGSGMDVALGALAMGATAERAVEVASQFIDSCGGGIDAMGLD